MTVLLWTAIALVAVVAALALALGLALAARYRQLQAELARTAEHRHEGGSGGLPQPGRLIKPWSALDTTGAVVGSELAGRRLAVFVMVGCSTCSEHLPGLRTALAEPHHQALRPLAVVSGEAGGRAGYVEALRDVAQVVEEEDLGPVTSAYGVQLFPAVVLSDGEEVAAAGVTIGELGLPVPA
jgi:hypothetical protein